MINSYLGLLAENFRSHLTTSTKENMEEIEWEELLSLREEMNANLMAQGAEVQEKYVELLVKSLEGKGDPPVRTVNRTS